MGGARLSIEDEAGIDMVGGVVAKAMKRVAAFVVAVVCVLALGAGAGCSAQSEDAAVEAALVAELEVIKGLDEAFVEAAAQMLAPDLDAYGLDAKEFVGAYLEGFDYEISDIFVEGDSATATVTMTCKSIAVYLAELQGVSNEASAEGSLEGLGAGEVAVGVGALMMEAWDVVVPTACAPVTVECVKSGDAWTVKASSAEAVAAVLFTH